MPAMLPIALVATAAGAGIAGYSAYEGGQQQKALEQYNAQLAQQQAQSDLQQAAGKAQLERTEGQMRLSKERAQYAAAGVVLSSGSPLTDLAKQAGVNELRAEQTEYEGSMASDLEMDQSQLDVMQGSAAAEAGDLGAVGSILSGAGAVGSGFYGKKG